MLVTFQKWTKLNLTEAIQSIDTYIFLLKLLYLVNKVIIL